MDDNVEPTLRLGGFLLPIFFRWPHEPSTALVPKLKSHNRIGNLSIKNRGIQRWMEQAVVRAIGIESYNPPAVFPAETISCTPQ